MNKTGIFINKKFKLAIVGCVVFLLMIGVTGTLLTRKGPNDLNTAGNTNTNIANEAHMTYDGQWMYYTEDNGREEEGYDYRKEYLVKSRLDGSEKQYLTNGEDSEIESIFVGDDKVYFIKDHGLLYSIDKSGGNEEALSNGYEGSVRAERIFGMTEDRLYYLAQRPTETAEQNEYGWSNAICCLQLEVDREDILFQYDNIYPMAALISNGQIYFSANNYINGDHFGGSVQKISIEGGEAEVLYTTEETNDYFFPAGVNLFVEGKTIYFLIFDAESAEEESTMVFSMDKSGGNLEQIGSIPTFPWITECIINNKSMYVLAWNILNEDSDPEYETRLYRIGLESGTYSEPEECQVDNGQCSDLQIIEDGLYYKNKNYELKRVPL